MKTINMFTTIDELIIMRTKINEQIQNYKIMLNHYDNLIDTVNKEIYIKCKHEWTIDRSNSNEHTEYICSLCNLSK